MDQYSDLVTVTKPVIYISIGEIINTHTVSLNSQITPTACLLAQHLFLSVGFGRFCHPWLNWLTSFLLAAAGPSGRHRSRAQWPHPWAAGGPGRGSHCGVPHRWVEWGRKGFLRPLYTLPFWEICGKIVGGQSKTAFLDLSERLAHWQTIWSFFCSRVRNLGSNSCWFCYIKFWGKKIQTHTQTTTKKKLVGLNGQKKPSLLCCIFKT